MIGILDSDHRAHYLIQETDRDVITAVRTSSFHIAKVLAAALAFDSCRPIEIRRGAEVIATVSPSDSPLAKISNVPIGARLVLRSL